MSKQLALPPFLALFGEISHTPSRLRQAVARRLPARHVPDEKLADYLVDENLNEDIHSKLRAALRGETLGVAEDQIHGLVCYTVEDMCSSHLGERKALVFGPGCTFKTLHMALWQDDEKKHARTIDMGLASTIKWPEAYFIKPEFEENYDEKKHEDIRRLDGNDIPGVDSDRDAVRDPGDEKAGRGAGEED